MTCWTSNEHQNEQRNSNDFTRRKSKTIRWVSRNMSCWYRGSEILMGRLVGSHITETVDQINTLQLRASEYRVLHQVPDMKEPYLIKLPVSTYGCVCTRHSMQRDSLSSSIMIKNNYTPLPVLCCSSLCNTVDSISLKHCVFCWMEKRGNGLAHTGCRSIVGSNFDGSARSGICTGTKMTNGHWVEFKIQGATKCHRSDDEFPAALQLLLWEAVSKHHTFRSSFICAPCGDCTHGRLRVLE